MIRGFVLLEGFGLFGFVVGLLLVCLFFFSSSPALFKQLEKSTGKFDNVEGFFTSSASH